MIKSITKLLNSRIVLQKQFARFAAPKEIEDDVPIDEDIVQLGKQQLQAVVPQGQVVDTLQGAEVVAQPTEFAYVDQDPFQGVNLLESNWKDIAPLIHTTYYNSNKDPRLHAQVRQKLGQIESMYGLDLNNLNRVKILQHKEFQIRSNINATSWQTNRYLQNDIAENSRIGYSMMTGKKFRELLDTNNVQAIKQLYRNNEFLLFQLQADSASKIIDIVVENNFQNQFMLNLIENLRILEKDKLLKPTKNFEKVLQNIHECEEVNKLKFFWKVNSGIEGGKEFVRYGIVNHELAKVKFQGMDGLVCERALRDVYSGVLGNVVMKKLIDYSLDKFSANFGQFLQFWGLFNLLISRLVNLNETSIANPHSLNSIFNLFQLNFQEPKQIITQIIPEALFLTKSKMLFQIYRVHAKFWMERKPDPKLSIVAGPFDQWLNAKIDLEETVQITYNPLESQGYFPSRAQIRTSKKAARQPDRSDQILSQTKMLQHLIKGDYSFVLNHFLLVFNPGLQKDSFNQLRKILNEAKQPTFTDQNAKALYILRKINERFYYQSQPVAFRQEFLTDFKKIKWLQRKEGDAPRQRKPYVPKMWDLEDRRYSRKQAERIDSEEPPIDNKERIFRKPQIKEGALFSKKTKNLFSTQKDSYTEYRQVVKDVSAQTHPPAEFGFKLAMDRFTDLNTFKHEIQQRSKEMNEVNHKVLFNTSHLPIVGTGSNLMKYLFLKKPQGEVPKVGDDIKKKLRVSFVSEIGALEKDFSQYLEGCRFTFPLAEQVYTALLQDQKTNYVRKSFKTIISHMIAYKKSLSDTQIQLICDICKKYRIGITLIQFYNLMIQNKIPVSRQAIYIMCDSLQKFRKINGDIFLMTKKYCENLGVQFEVNMMSSYVKSLLIEEQDEKLAELCQTLKTQLRPKAYKLRPQLSAQQNIAQQKQHKEFQKKEYNKILNSVINVVVLNVNNKLPVFVSQLFDQYEKTQVKLQPNEIAISLIVYCNDVDKFLTILRGLKQEPEKIVLTTFECAIKALRLNHRGLEGHSEEIFNTTLFTHNFMLTEELILKSVQIFKLLTSPTVFIKFLQYLLRYNPILNYQIKSNMYFVMNSINDDFAKNTISGMLDFIFNSNREKERDQYRKAQIAQEAKAKLLQDIEKKDFFFGKTDNQKERIADDIEKGKLNEAKKPKKNKSLMKERTKEQEKYRAQSPASVKTERRRITGKDEESLVLPPSDGIIRKALNLKAKLRSKSLNNFQEMFTPREQVVEEEKPVKGQKGGKLPQQKDVKKKGGK